MNKPNLTRPSLSKIITIGLLVIGAGIFGIYSPSNAVIASNLGEGFEGSIENYRSHGEKAQFFQVNDSAKARTGKGALLIDSQNSVGATNASEELTRWMTKIDQIAVTVGQKYRVEAYMRTEGIKDNAKLAVSFFATEKGKSWISTVSSVSVISSDQDWQKIAVVVTVPKDAKFMRPEFRLYDSGKLFIDDLTITDLETKNEEAESTTDTPTPTEPVTITNQEEQIGEQIAAEMPENTMLNQPARELAGSDYTINFSPSNSLAANAAQTTAILQISFPSNCEPSHRLNDDPIVFPNRRGASHSHDFFGDTLTNAHSTVQSILDNAGNTCLPDDDRSAYWLPTVYDNGRAQDADTTKFYYKAGFVDPKTVQTIPTGLRIIAGNARAETNQSPQVGYWWASEPLNNPDASPDFANTTRGRSTMISAANSRESISLRLNFPQCWDGRNLYLPNSTHMAYPGRRDPRTGYSSCPATHPVPIPMLLMIVNYPGANGGSDFRLASGSWSTFHADFINAWHPATLEGLIDKCIRTETRCRQVRETTCAARGLSPRNCVDIRPRLYME